MSRVALLNSASAVLVVAAAAAMFLRTGPAMAVENDVVSLECRFSVEEAHAAYLPNRMSVSFSPWGSSAEVHDPIIEKVVGGPIVAKIDTLSRTQVRLSWPLALKVPGKRLKNIQYNLTVLLPGREAVVSIGVTESFLVSSYQAVGKCQPVKQ